MTASRSEPRTITRYPNPAIAPLLASYDRHLRAERKRPATVKNYTMIARLFSEFAEDKAFPALPRLKREHVEMWLAGLEERGYSPYTQRMYYIGVKQWFAWLLEEGEIKANPTERMRAPSVDEVEKDVVSAADMAKVLAGLEKAKKWRNVALVALLYDTGMRAGETVSLMREDVDFDRNIIRLSGENTKARRGRVVAISEQCARHLDRYLRKRKDTHPHLWVGPKGPTTASGLYRIITDIFASTGRKIGPHDLRHTSATHTAGKMSETDQMMLYGWKDASMARHYSRQAHEANAIAAHRKASPLERLDR